MPGNSSSARSALRRRRMTQKAFHDLIGADETLGWDTQLPNEPVINVSLTTAHLLAKDVWVNRPRRIVPGSLGLGTYFTARDSACTAKPAGISSTRWVVPPSERG